MLRQGRAAVQATYELEVINTEYVSEEAVVTGGDLTGRKGVTPINVLTVVKGKLHMRMGNVGEYSVSQGCYLVMNTSDVIERYIRTVHWSRGL